MAHSISKIKFRLISLAVSEEKILIEIVDDAAAAVADNDAGHRTTTIAYGLPAGKLKRSNFTSECNNKLFFCSIY